MRASVTPHQVGNGQPRRQGPPAGSLLIHPSTIDALGSPDAEVFLGPDDHQPIDPSVLVAGMSESRQLARARPATVHIDGRPWSSMTLRLDQPLPACTPACTMAIGQKRPTGSGHAFHYVRMGQGPAIGLTFDDSLPEGDIKLSADLLSWVMLHGPQQLELHVLALDAPLAAIAIGGSPPGTHTAGPAGGRPAASLHATGSSGPTTGSPASQNGSHATHLQSSSRPAHGDHILLGVHGQILQHATLQEGLTRTLSRPSSPLPHRRLPHECLVSISLTEHFVVTSRVDPIPRHGMPCIFMHPRIWHFLHETLAPTRMHETSPPLVLFSHVICELHVWSASCSPPVGPDPGQVDVLLPPTIMPRATKYPSQSISPSLFQIKILHPARELDVHVQAPGWPLPEGHSPAFMQALVSCLHSHMAAVRALSSRSYVLPAGTIPGYPNVGELYYSIPAGRAFGPDDKEPRALVYSSDTMLKVVLGKPMVLLAEGTAPPTHTPARLKFLAVDIQTPTDHPLAHQHLESMLKSHIAAHPGPCPLTGSMEDPTSGLPVAFHIRLLLTDQGAATPGGRFDPGFTAIHFGPRPGSGAIITDAPTVFLLSSPSRPGHMVPFQVTQPPRQSPFLTDAFILPEHYRQLVHLAAARQPCTLSLGDADRPHIPPLALRTTFDSFSRANCASTCSTCLDRKFISTCFSWECWSTASLPHSEEAPWCHAHQGPPTTACATELQPTQSGLPSLIIPLQNMAQWNVLGSVRTFTLHAAADPTTEPPQPQSIPRTHGLSPAEASGDAPRDTAITLPGPEDQLPDSDTPGQSGPDQTVAVICLILSDFSEGDYQHMSWTLRRVLSFPSLIIRDRVAHACQLAGLPAKDTVLADPRGQPMDQGHVDPRQTMIVFYSAGGRINGHPSMLWIDTSGLPAGRHFFLQILPHRNSDSPMSMYVPPAVHRALLQAAPPRPPSPTADAHGHRTPSPPISSNARTLLKFSPPAVQSPEHAMPFSTAGSLAQGVMDIVAQTPLHLNGLGYVLHDHGSRDVSCLVPCRCCGGHAHILLCKHTPTQCVPNTPDEAATSPSTLLCTDVNHIKIAQDNALGTAPAILPQPLRQGVAIMPSTFAPLSFSGSLIRMTRHVSSPNATNPHVPIRHLVMAVSLDRSTMTSHHPDYLEFRARLFLTKHFSHCTLHLPMMFQTPYLSCRVAAMVDDQGTSLRSGIFIGHAPQEAIVAQHATPHLHGRAPAVPTGTRISFIWPGGRPSTYIRRPIRIIPIRYRD
ncbi:hypothetical protein H696_02553 [Fonticula alba]|uniref:Uncharacterized protein n=1 Tax=Fonticula alba TaxID=691883 RepID=A0A058Z8H2_FONAL|nr:hypothetical protein H696_02553 [Fonticula alba]KCV70223.1 hypothetical protein H696_02553 [Fonticula alba]|eukprot:XP_009494739.1 hypothetical protein H696_02553 [Fonticula alba]